MLPDAMNESLRHSEILMNIFDYTLYMLLICVTGKIFTSIHLNQFTTKKDREYY